METVIGQLTSFAASVECITKSLEEHSNDDIVIKNIESVNDVIQSAWMQSFNINDETKLERNENFQLKFFSKQLEEVVVGLWNATVSRQCAKSIQERTAVMLRQLCYDLLISPICAYKSVMGSNDPRLKPYMHRRIMMAIKSGKGWLELCEYKKAENALLSARKDIENLQEILNNLEQTESCEEVIALNKHQVNVLCYQAEAACHSQCDQQAYELTEAASSLPFLLSPNEDDTYARETERICVTSYNFGLNAANNHRLETALKWLSFSFDFGKKRKQINPKQLAQTLRLLAHVYCETGARENIAKALNAVELANSYSCHPAGIHLRHRTQTF